MTHQGFEKEDRELHFLWMDVMGIQRGTTKKKVTLGSSRTRAKQNILFHLVTSVLAICINVKIRMSNLKQTERGAGEETPERKIYLG